MLLAVAHRKVTKISSADFWTDKKTISHNFNDYKSSAETVIFSQVEISTGKGQFSPLSSAENITPKNLEFRTSDSCTEYSLFHCTVDTTEIRYFTLDEWANDNKIIRLVKYTSEIPEFSKLFNIHESWAKI